MALRKGASWLDEKVSSAPPKRMNPAKTDCGNAAQLLRFYGLISWATLTRPPMTCRPVILVSTIPSTTVVTV